MLTIKKAENNNFPDEKPINLSLCTNHFKEIPPIIGMIIANQNGISIIPIENDLKNQNNHGPIISYLNKSDNPLFDVDLISMYFSSFMGFAGHVNIQNLSHLEIHGSNIKVQIKFLSKRFFIIIFLNAKTELNYQQKNEITNYFKELIIKNENAFNNFNNQDYRKILHRLKMKGRSWLRRINKKYLEIIKV